METTGTNYTLNRPVYLGRRDVFMERAIEFLPQCLKEAPVKKRLGHINAMLYYLHSALEPTVLAAKTDRVDPQEQVLVVFLRLVLCYLQSARALMENESQLDNTRSPLWRFLHRDGKMGSAVNFSQSSERLLQDVAQMFSLAAAPFRDLQKELVKAMSREEQDRYRRAYDNLKIHSQSADYIRRVSHMRPNFLASS